MQDFLKRQVLTSEKTVLTGASGHLRSVSIKVGKELELQSAVAPSGPAWVPQAASYSLLGAPPF